MVNKTLLSATTSERSSSRQSRKYSATDIGDFAGLLSVQTDQAWRQPQNFGRESSGLKTSSQTETRDASMKKAASDDSRTDRSQNNDTNDSNVHNASDKDTDNSTRSSADSKAEGSEQTTQSVDGGETNSTPGASTEAAVNAQSNSASENSLESQLASQTDPTQASQQASELQQLLQKVAGESTATKITKDNVTPTKISAKSIETKNPNLQTNLNLTSQQIIFETGLAEHFVRLLTDQFDQLEKSSAKKTEATPSDTASQTTSVSLGSVTTDTSKTNLNLAFPTATPTQTPEDQAAENMSKIMHIVRSNLGRRQSQLTVRLDPPELGKMQVDVKVIDNNLQLAITTDTAEAKQMLSSRMETLRNSLEQSGITLSKFEIVSKADNAASNQNDQQFQDQSRNGNGGFQQQQHQQPSDFASDTDASSQSSSAEDSADSISTITGVDSSDENLNLVA